MKRNAQQIAMSHQQGKAPAATHFVLRQADNTVFAACRSRSEAWRAQESLFNEERDRGIVIEAGSRPARPASPEFSRAVKSGFVSEIAYSSHLEARVATLAALVAKLDIILRGCGPLYATGPVAAEVKAALAKAGS